MLHHPIFRDLPLHSTQDLSERLGSTVQSRTEVHAWPLSVVERVRLADGRVLAYKSQLPPTVEPAFYEAVASPLLPGHQALGALGAAETMVLEWIGAPLLSSLSPSPDELVRHGRAVQAAISEVDVGAPVWLDIGSADAWSRVVDQTCADWQSVIDDGFFTRTTARSVAFVRHWAQSPPVVAAIESAGRIVHADLRADQIFVTGDGYRVIDWQRPALAPADVDLVSLLVGQGVDPAPHVVAAAIGIHWFMVVHWAVEAQHTLFPGSRFPLFDDWARQSVDGIRATS
jgi:hypothetical protein